MIEQERTALKATAYLRSISNQGGYAGIYKNGLQYGEATFQPVGAGQIWIQPPGTPTIGQDFLNLYDVTGDRYYYDAALDVERALSLAQSTAGGWAYVCTLQKGPRTRTPGKLRSNGDTMDDNTTQAAVMFLMRIAATRWGPSNAADAGVAYLLAAQSPAGAWPQQWPPTNSGDSNYQNLLTLNDGVTADCITAMLEAHGRYGSKRYLDSACRAGDFILRTANPVWCQQYDMDLKPAKARAYEPAAFGTEESSLIIRSLIDLYVRTGDGKWLAPIPAAFQWFDKVKLGDNLWARFYEIGTDRPIYTKKDGTIVYNPAQLSEADKVGYSVMGAYSVKDTRGLYEHLLRTGPVNWHERAFGVSELTRLKLVAELTVKANILAHSMDGKGRWLRSDGSMWIADYHDGLRTIYDLMRYSK